ncbi:unnamed protein product [Rotaria sp. Silwood2]|nr:unnamed protein product [Rotaria sp. Silwood2]CAF4639566.1 unnamed protein product [Rotaria sp. Silwood2]
MDSPAFSSFCDARSINKSLIELDLRNNDISHVGGSELATALKRNVTLRVLVGSRALLAARQSSSIRNELHLTDNVLAKNTEKCQIPFGHSQNMAILARQVQNIYTKKKDRQITSALKRVSLQEQAILKANK